MQKVVIITTRHGPQDDRIYFKEALSLAKKFRVVLIAPDDGEKLNWDERVKYCAIRRRHGILGRVWSVVESVFVARRENPDFCHVQDLDLALALPMLRLLTKAKLVYDCHEAFPEQFMMNESVPLLLRRLMSRGVDLFEKTFVRFGHYVVTADEPTRRSFEKTHLPSTTIFNYPLLNMFKDSMEYKNVNKSRKSKVVLVYHGSMSKERGLFHMIDGLSLLKELCDIELLLVGLKDHKLRNEAKKYAQEKNVLDRLKIIEWVPFEKIANILESCDIGLVPWQPEEKHKRNIPIKLFEYMACGLPVIAADLPSISPYVKEAKSGLLYDSTNPAELARCVLELIKDPAKKNKMGENGRKAVKEKWNWDEMEKQLFSVYKKLNVDI